MNRIAKLLLPFLAWALHGIADAAETGWMTQVGKALGKAGTEMPGGVYRVGLGRSDLKVTLDGVEIKPALALGSWLARSEERRVG